MGRSDWIENPYTPPDADLGRWERPGGPGMLWKAYFVILALLWFPTFAILGVEWLQPLDVVDHLVGVVSMVGLFGYAFRRPLGREGFWKLWLPGVVVWDVSFEMVFTAAGLAGQIPGLEPSGPLEIGITLVLLFPLYLAIFRYGFRSGAVWNPASASRHEGSPSIQ